MNRIKAIIIKEFYQIIRDPSSIIIAVILPILLIIIFSFGVSLDANHIRIGIVAPGSTPEVESFIESFTNSRYFDVEVAKNRNDLTPKLLAGTIRGIIIIQHDFTKKLLNNSQTAPIQVIADGSEPNTASFVQNYSRGAWQNWLKNRALNKGQEAFEPISIEQRFWYNPELESRHFLLPGSLAIIMTLIGTLLTALVISREWERGTMEALMATPITIFEILIGKLIPYYILGMISMILSVSVITIFFQVPFRGTIPILLLVSSVFLFASLGQGLLISTLSKNQFVASQIALISGFLPAFMLSGFIFEITSMPASVQFITTFISAKYFVNDLLSLFLVGNVWAIIVPNTLIMLLIGLILFIITASKTVKRLD